MNLSSLLAQLPTLNPTEITHIAAFGLTVPTAEIAEVLATLLDPQQQGALPATQPATPVGA